MEHLVKCVQPYFEESINLRKLFEVRNNDRDYHVGDVITNKEWSEEGGFTGREASFFITYILDDERYCLPGTIIMSLKPNWQRESKA